MLWKLFSWLIFGIAFVAVACGLFQAATERRAPTGIRASECR